MKPDQPPIIRRALAADIAALAELAAITFVDTFGHLYARQDLDTFLRTSRSANRYMQLLEDPAVSLWIAQFQTGQPVGYAVVGPCKLPVAHLEPTAGEVRELYVRAGHQGHQLGSSLLQQALQWLEGQGHHPQYIGVWSENYGAQRLYGRFGFTRVGEYGFPVGDHMDLEFILKRS